MSHGRVWIAVAGLVVRAATGAVMDLPAAPSNEASTESCVAPLGSVSGATLRGFASLLSEKHSYTVAGGHGDEIKARAEAFLAANPGADGPAVAQEMARILGRSVDGHAEMDTPAWSAERPPFHSFLLVPVGDVPGTGVVAVAPSRSSLLDADKPYVTAINGVEIEALIARAGEYIADGSPALVRERSCRLLRSAWFSGADEQSASVRVSLAASPDAARGSWQETEVPLTPKKPIYGEWPRTESKTLADGTIGYLRLASMSDEDAESARVRTQLAGFAECDSLIIDVRGNSGGSRAGLLAIAGAVMPPTQPFVVYNAARPLKLGESRADIDRRMGSRFMVPIDSLAGDEAAAARALVEKLTAENKDLRFDDAAFAGWYVGIAERDETRSWWKPGRRVFVLMDHVCFSATDIFLMTMKEIDGVTLIGRPSAGGSGLAQRHTIPGGVRVRLSSMVSFQPDGGLVDGRGVHPDVLIWPRQTDFIVGGTDTALDGALKIVSTPER